MGKRSGPNRRIVAVRGHRFELCGLVLRDEKSRRCRPRGRLRRARGGRAASLHVVALTSCLSFLFALVLSGYAVSRGPALLPTDPQRELPAAAVAHHTIADLFNAASR